RTFVADYAVTTLPPQLSTLAPTPAHTVGADCRTAEGHPAPPHKGASEHGHFLRRAERAVRPLHCQLKTRSLGNRDRRYSRPPARSCQQVSARPAQFRE